MKLKLSPSLRADLMLLTATVFWGSSYLFMITGLRDLEVFNLIALRFGIAFLLAGGVFVKSLAAGGLMPFLTSCPPGLLLCAAFAAVAFGLKTTSASKAECARHCGTYTLTIICGLPPKRTCFTTP